MTAATHVGSRIPRIVLGDPELLHDPFGVYGRAREESPLIRLLAPGITPIWALTRLEDSKAMLADARFEFTAESLIRPDIPEAARPYLRVMHVDAEGHRRLRKLVAPSFTPRRAAEFRPRVEAIVESLLDELSSHANGTVDLLRHFAQPLPIDVTCEFLGIPQSDRLRWREYGAALGSGEGERFGEAMSGILEDTRAAIAYRTSDPGDDVISALIRAQAEDGDRLGDMEMEALIWITVAASSTVKHFFANAVVALLTHPEQLTTLRESPELLPNAVEELVRFSGLNLISIPRFAREDVELHGVVIRAGDPIVAVVASANRDPRVFTDPDRLDVTRPIEPLEHLGFGYGPHICTGNWVGRVLTEVGLGGLLRRFPDLALAVDPQELRRVPDPGTWRLESVPVTL